MRLLHGLVIMPMHMPDVIRPIHLYGVNVRTHLKTANYGG